MISKKIMALAVVSLMGFTAAACNQGTYGSNQAIGTLAGAAAGGLLGNQVGRGSGRVAATIAGAAIGGVLGGALGANLDAQDRQLASNAQYSAFNSGRPTQWRGPQSGYYGSVQPGPAFNNGGYQCREYTHTVYIGGRPERAYGTACRQPDGSWQIVG